MATKTKKTRQSQQKQNLVDSLAGLRWLGSIVTWSSGTDGSAHTQQSVVDALTHAGLSPNVSRELAPRNAWARAAKHLSDERIIEVFKEEGSDIVFQFTKQHLTDSGWEYDRECFVRLNKNSGIIECDDHDINTKAQDELDKAMEARTTSDITRIVQRLFDASADLIPMRDAGGVYFVPQEYTEFVDRIELFLSKLGGYITRIPIPEGTQSGDKAIQDAVKSSIEKVIDDHMLAVKSFEVNTRKDTIERAADKIKTTRVKIEAYAHYLGEQQKALFAKIADANELLKETVEKIGGGAPARSEYDWDKILDGKIHQLEADVDYLGQASTCLMRARTIAKQRGMRIRAKVQDDGLKIILQAMPNV